MKRIFFALMAAALVCGSFMSLPAFAQQKQDSNQKQTPGVNERQENQRKRIRKGVKKGELTKDEAKTLRGEQKAVEAQKKAAKADSTVTKEERKSIKESQKKASKDIRQEKHDAQTKKKN